MLKASFLSLAFAVGGMVPAWEASAVPMVAGPVAGAGVVKVGEGCGPNMWRDRLGNCHPFLGPGGVARGTRFECPPGHHIGPGGARCYPNL